MTFFEFLNFPFWKFVDTLSFCLLEIYAMKKENIVNSGALANVAEGCDLAIGKALGTDQYVLAIRNTLARDVRWVSNRQLDMCPSYWIFLRSP